MFLSNLILLDSTGISWGTILTTAGLFLIGLLTALFKSEAFGEFLTGLFDWAAKKGILRKKGKDGGESSARVKETDIMNHDIFNYMDFWLYNQIPSITLKTQYRTAVFRKYLHIYFKTYKDVIIDFVKGESYKGMDSAELRKTLLDLITDITIKMELEMRTIGIPDVIILKMKNVLSDRMNLTMDLINSICDSSFYDSEDNLLKIYSFLNITHSILDNTISNVEPVCNNLNGELNGLTIDGYTEPASGDDNN